jgi:sorting nexin-41/42
MTQDGLESKRESLEELERSEREARRLEAALGRGRVNGISPTYSQSAEGGQDAQEEQTVENGEEAQEPPSYLPPHPGPNPLRRKTRTPGMGLLSALSYTLHGMMDVDPEAARRNGITKTRETISQVRFQNRL